jgi:hypothetical protein
LAVELKKPIPRGYARQVFRDIINGRVRSVHANPNLKKVDRWDQSDIFYKARKRLDAEGYDVEIYKDDKKRKALYKYIKEYCDKLGIKRHEIGIFPADRAVLAFQGELYSVSFENYKSLAYLGTDIICVEKEGIVDKLVPFTENFGIAFIQSQGFVSEYGEMLAKLAHQQGANVMILTDFDAAGIEMGFSIGVTRLGVDIDTIEELNKEKSREDALLYKNDLKESYDGSTHWISLNNLAYSHPTTNHKMEYISYLLKYHDEQRYIDFLKNDRIELNTIMNEVGALRFWNWLKNKLIQTFPTRDYNRAISIPRYILTPTMEWFQQELQDRITEILADIVDESHAYLGHTQGLLHTGDKQNEIESELLRAVLSHPDIKQIDLGIKQLLGNGVYDTKP